MLGAVGMALVLPRRLGRGRGGRGGRR
jgi:hypothetical protein